MANPTAPYRFIPIEPNYVQAAPVARKDIRFDRPLAGCSVSGVLKVEWTAMTPVCIGDAAVGDSEVTPLKVNERYCLSGTSLRGMLRSVIETVTFAHLGRINSHHHHSERDFAGMGMHAVTPAALKAGWLRWSAEDGKWRLYPGRNDMRKQAARPGQNVQQNKGNQNPHKFVLTPIDQILAKFPAGSAPSKTKWQGQMSIPEKYAALQAANINPKPDMVFPLKGAESPSSKEVLRVALARGDKPDGRPVEFPDGYPSSKLNFVFTGPYEQEATNGKSSGGGGTPKQNEPLFPEPISEGCVIPQKWMDLFHRMNSSVTKDRINPRIKSAWRHWLRALSYDGAFEGFREDSLDETIPEAMRKLPGIPVFWIGDLDALKKVDPENPGNVGDQPFWFSLSRVIRIPHSYSVGEVAQRLYASKPGQAYRVPRLEQKNGWDFAKALFGSVDQDSWFEVNSKTGKQAKADGTNVEDSQRGRVATGFAWAPAGTKVDPRSRISGVFSNPRESFWPFYLRHLDGKPDGSGYADLTASYSSESAIPAGRKRTVVRKSVAAPLQSDNTNVLTSIQFLPAGTTFSGEVRFHNLGPVELGALLFALTLGHTDGTRWHQIGRAKGLGYGSLKPRVTISRPFNVVGTPPSNVAAAPVGDIASWMAVFEEWMDTRLADRRLPSLRHHGTIRALMGASDPQNGAAMAADLRQMELKDFAVVKKACAEARDGARTARYPLDGP